MSYPALEPMPKRRGVLARLGIGKKRAPILPESTFTGSKGMKAQGDAKYRLDVRPSEYQPEETATPPKGWSEAEEKEFVTEIDEQYRSAHTGRWPLAMQWALGLAYYEGNQWLWPDMSGKYLSLAQNPNERLRYLTSDKVRPLCNKVEAIVTMASPDVACVPLNPNDQLDVKAAKEAEAIRGHCARKFDRPTQLKHRVNWCLKSTTCFLKLYWDDSADNQFPVYDDAGQLVEYTTKPIGDICEDIVPGFEVYLDPMARDWQEVRWLIHAKVMPLSTLVSKYGDRAKTVNPDCESRGYASFVDGYMQGGTGGGPLDGIDRLSADARGRMNAVVVKEYWELPSARFENGRYVVTAGGVLLVAEEWPYEKRDTFPFVPLSWQPSASTPYGMGLAGDLTPLQFAYNRTFSSIYEQMENQVDYLAVPQGSEPGPDALQSLTEVGSGGIPDGRTVRTVYYKAYDGLQRPMSPPVFSRSPGIGQERMVFLDKIEADMRHKAGVHDVTDGNAPADMPAMGIRLLQQSDQTQHSHLRAEIERSAKDIAEWEIALFTQYAPTDLVGGMDEDNNAMEEGEGQEEENSPILTFEALREGGIYRVTYSPGSSIALTQDEKNMQHSAAFMNGEYGDPAGIPAKILLARLKDSPDTEKIIKSLEAELEMMVGMQEAAGQGEAEAAQAEAEMKAAEGQQKLALEQEKAAMNMEVKQAELAMEMQRQEQEMAFEAARQEREAMVEEDRAAREMQINDAKHQQQMQMAEDNRALSLAEGDMRLRQSEAEGKQKLTFAERQARMKARQQQQQARQQAKTPTPRPTKPNKPR